MAFRMLRFLFSVGFLLSHAMADGQPAAVGVARRNCSDPVACRGVCREACNLDQLTYQLQITAKGVPRRANLTKVALDMFTPKAVMVVIPIAAYSDSLVALEYILTFSRAPAQYVPPPVATLTGLELQDMVLSGNTATTVFDILLKNPFDQSKKARLRGWSMLAFNEVSKIQTQTIIYPLWEETMQALGLASAVENPLVTQVVANYICTAHEQFCKGDNKQYTSQTACAEFLKGLASSPQNRLAGNNRFCRFFHARFVDVSPEVHCPHIGPTGGGKCVEDLPYSMDKLGTLMPQRPTFYSVSRQLQGRANRTAKWS